MPHPWTKDVLERLRRTAGLAEVDFYEQLDSTNTLALEQVRNGRPVCPLLVLAHEQTAGRGRAQNKWWSQEGALTFSLVLDELRRDTACLPLIMGLAVAQSLQRRLGECFEVRVKWPNDVYVADRKVAGLLVESIGGEHPVVVGCGLNVNQRMDDAPAEIRGNATSLFSLTGFTIDLPDLLQQVIAEMLQWSLAGEAGKRQWLGEYQRICWLTGSLVELRQGHRSIVGRCRGVDAEGRLVVETESGSQTFNSGTVRRVNQ